MVEGYNELNELSLLQQSARFHRCRPSDRGGQRVVSQTRWESSGRMSRVIAIFHGIGRPGNGEKQPYAAGRERAVG